jgi:nitrate reductase assembly molybdenum cofactor insertion protein NarJ
MIELVGIYRHYGLALNGGEMPDFLPLVLDFLAVSVDRRDGEDGALRTQMITRYVQPAVTAMHERFREHGGPWLLAIDALSALLRAEVGEARTAEAGTSDVQQSNLVQIRSSELSKELS